MFPPVDYPFNVSKEDAADAAEITYAALLDRYDSEQPITNDMIQRACQKMDEAQQFPFAPVDGVTSVDGVNAVSDKPMVHSSAISAAISSTAIPLVTPITSASSALLGRLKNIIS